MKSIPPTHPLQRCIRLLCYILSCSLLLSSFVPLVLKDLGWTSLAQGTSPSARPHPAAPEGGFPNLDEVRRRPSEEPRAPQEIHSTIRSRHNPEAPRNGRRVGDTLPTSAMPNDSENRSQTLSKLGDVKKRLSRPGRIGRSSSSSILRRSHHAGTSMKAAPLPLLDDQFIENFFYWALGRYSNPTEATYWKDIHRSAYANGQGSIVLTEREMGKTLFESTEYALRGRNDHWFVYDLYKTYLMRDPDPGGWSYWESMVPSQGREAVRRAFDESAEFLNLVSAITPNGGITSAVSSLTTARVDRINQPGNGLLSRDVSWSITLLSLRGRAGLNLGLGLSYSSLVWTRSGPYIYFDEDTGYPSPGFRLGFPTIQERYFDAQVGDNVYLLITSSGQRVELRQVGTSNIYEAGDSSYLQLTDNGTSLLVRATDGTQMTYAKFNTQWRCTQIKDRNGNYLTVNYSWQGNLSNVTDTLGRVVNFNY
ncbi:MAG TPA: DUF4214 domain-containing protein [Pyrinomonadaceae bacterium]|nr:DUF4214 domain-containing protein [Pyrinomonadaceae bacterium]